MSEQSQTFLQLLGVGFATFLGLTLLTIVLAAFLGLQLP